MKKAYTIPNKKERDAYMAGQKWGEKRTAREFKKAITLALWGFPAKYIGKKDLLKAYSEGKEDVANELLKRITNQ